MRGFKIAKGYEDKAINLPIRATVSSAGYDIEAAEEITIKPHQIAFIKTGIKAYMQSDEVLKIYPRSSLAKKKGLMLANNVGIVDADYYENVDNDGHIMIMVLNISDIDATVMKGERVAQGIFEKFLLADGDMASGIREGGFGSTILVKK